MKANPSCSLKSNQNPIIIGISGPSASGKSSLASTIVAELGSNKVSVIREDSYYKDQSHIPFDIRGKTNYDHPSAFDHELLKKHIKLLLDYQEIETPVYNFSIHTREQCTITVPKNNVFVIEGILLFADEELRNLMDIKIFIDTPLDLCVIRRIQRDVLERGRSLESILEQYQSTVKPMFLSFIEPTKRYADLIVPGSWRNKVAVDIIKARIRELLKNETRN